jgi:hypothetical protein
MKKVIAALIGFAAISLSESAIAVPVANKDELGNIAISEIDLAPGTAVTVRYPQILFSKSFNASGACNLVTITSNKNFEFYDYIKVNETQIDLDFYELPALSGAPCVKGVPNPGYRWKTQGSYKYVQSADLKKVFFVGITSSVTIETDTAKARPLKVDSCGRILLKNNEKWPVEKIQLSGSLSYKLANGSDFVVPVGNSTKLPICYQGILYKALE